jgi:hypothetical protein
VRPVEASDHEIVHHEEVSTSRIAEESTVADKENRNSAPPTTPAVSKKSVKVEE